MGFKWNFALKYQISLERFWNQNDSKWYSLESQSEFTEQVFRYDMKFTKIKTWIKFYLTCLYHPYWLSDERYMQQILQRELWVGYLSVFCSQFTKMDLLMTVSQIIPQVYFANNPWFLNHVRSPKGFHMLFINVNKH